MKLNDARYYEQLREVFAQSDGPAVWLVGVYVVVAWFLQVLVDGRKSRVTMKLS
jgi:hypothetical protein